MSVRRDEKSVRVDLYCSCFGEVSKCFPAAGSATSGNQDLRFVCRLVCSMVKKANRCVGVCVGGGGGDWSTAPGYLRMVRHIFLKASRVNSPTWSRCCDPWAHPGASCWR